MLTSIAYLFLLGLGLGAVLQKLHLPSLLGMLLAGMILGPYGLNQLDSHLLGISADLRQFALLIILLRAGLNLNIQDLKKVGRPAVLMCFVPACFEIIGMILLAPHLLGVSALDAAIMGAVVGAVSPAVIVPKMLHLMETGYGTQKSIPQMILAGASVDDVFVIVLFTAVTSLAQGNHISLMQFIQVPFSIVFGIIGGIVVSAALTVFFKKYHMRDTVKVLLLLSISFLLVETEHILEGRIPFSALLAVMGMGVMLQKTRTEMTARLASKFSCLWVAAEVWLFVLVGATVDIHYAASAGIAVLLLLGCVLLCRMAGVFCCLIKTPLTGKERAFCMIAYCPKATVQAAIGTVPLSLGLSCGKIVLTVAVLAILITAPLGAFAIEHSYRCLLKKEK